MYLIRPARRLGRSRSISAMSVLKAAKVFGCALDHSDSFTGFALDSSNNSAKFSFAPRETLVRGLNTIARPGGGVCPRSSSHTSLIFPRGSPSQDFAYSVTPPSSCEALSKEDKAFLRRSSYARARRIAAFSLGSSECLERPSRPLLGSYSIQRDSASAR